MTPLKPIENTTHLRGVLAGKYTRNPICAHPECDKPSESTHHIFGRPAGPNSGSYFVLIEKGQKIPLAHGIGLCGDGNTGHHGELEAHEAWIKYEDGVFNWYKRNYGYGGTHPEGASWELLGPLNPQPGFNEGKPKRANFKGKKRRSRKTISVKVPQDAQEDGGEIWDDLLGDGKGEHPYGRVRAKLDAAMGLAEPKRLEGGSRDVYYVLVDVLNDWVDS